MTSVFRQGFLSGSSEVSNTPTEAAQGTYDLMLLVSSWDRRCVCVTSAAGVRAERSVVVLFDTRDSQGLRDRHDRTLLDFAERTSTTCIPLKGNALDLKGLWKRLHEDLITLRREKRRPLAVFIDVSTCPRYYALAVLATCVGFGVARALRVFYSEGVYAPEKGHKTEEHEIFTAGTWSAVPIPGLQGQWDPKKKHLYLASVGFEGAKTFRTISSADPDRVAVLFPDPGTRPEYPARTRQCNEDLFVQYRIPEKDVVKAPAGDAIAAWKALSAAAVERPDEENVYYTCCGTKPHSIALALRAMTLEYPAVLYNLPDRHKVTEIEPVGSYWRFDIRNMALLPDD